MDITTTEVNMEIADICLNTPDDAALNGEWINMFLFDGVGYGITTNLNCVKMTYPTLSEVTEEMLTKMALCGYGSKDWNICPGGSPEYSDLADTFGKCDIISASRYAKELSQHLLSSKITRI